MKFAKLTIVPIDGLVSIDGQGYTKLSMTDVPEDIHALQWYGKGGEIEFIADDYGETKPYIRINKLPKWIEKSISVWETAKEDTEKLEAEEATRLLEAQEFHPEERPLPEDFPKSNS